MRICIITIIVLGSLCSNVFAQKNYGTFFNVTYLQTVSPTSILVNIPGQHPLIGDKIEVHLKGLDGPARTGRCQKERAMAKKGIEILDFLLKRAKNIALKKVERGQQFRLVAIVFADNKDVREVLIKKQLVVREAKKRPKKDWCQ